MKKVMEWSVLILVAVGLGWVNVKIGGGMVGAFLSGGVWGGVWGRWRREYGTKKEVY